VDVVGPWLGLEEAVVNVQLHPMTEWRTAALRAALRGKNFSEEAIADGRVINWRWVVHPAGKPVAGLFTVTRLVDEVGAQVRERTVEIDIIAEGGLQIETGLGK
jgi:hypothetical protein